MLGKDNLFLGCSRNIHPDNKYDYSLSEYVSYNTPIKIICNECGTLFKQQPQIHYKLINGSRIIIY